MNHVVLEVESAVRCFGKRIALGGVDLNLASGEILALVGPNGSGKTTLLKLLAGLLKPTSGRVRVFGMDPFACRAKVMVAARFAFAPPAWYPQLTARETLTFLTGIGAGGVERIDRAQISDALDTVGLLDRADDRVRVFSFGMRQRLALAQAILPTPKLLVLDEPTDGLDPLAILELRAVLRRLRDEHDVAILLSTHLMTEVEHLVDAMAVLHEGSLIFHGPPNELLRNGRCLRLALDGTAEAIARTIALMREEGSELTHGDNGYVTLPVGSMTLDHAGKLADRCGAVLKEFHEQRPTLEAALLDRLRAARERSPGDDGSNTPPRTDRC